MKSKKYLDYILFLENNEDDSYFVTIYKKGAIPAAQLDYTGNHKNSDNAYSEAKILIDSWKEKE